MHVFQCKWKVGLKRWKANFTLAFVTILIPPPPIEWFKRITRMSIALWLFLNITTIKKKLALSSYFKFCFQDKSCEYLQFFMIVFIFLFFIFKISVKWVALLLFVTFLWIKVLVELKGAAIIRLSSSFN